MTSYMIQINEEQRLIIETALYHFAMKHHDDEAKVLHEMTADLPNQPQTYIDANGKECSMLNGFCL